MNSGSILEIIAYLVIMSVCAWPLGGFTAKVLSGDRHLLSLPLGWLERGVHRVCGMRSLRLGQPRWCVASGSLTHPHLGLIKNPDISACYEPTGRT